MFELPCPQTVKHPSHGIDGEDTAEVVRVIEQRNGLSSATLTPGQLLEVPATV